MVVPRGRVSIGHLQEDQDTRNLSMSVHVASELTPKRLCLASDCLCSHSCQHCVHSRTGSENVRTHAQQRRGRNAAHAACRLAMGRRTRRAQWRACKKGRRPRQVGSAVRMAGSAPARPAKATGLVTCKASGHSHAGSNLLSLRIACGDVCCGHLVDAARPVVGRSLLGFVVKKPLLLGLLLLKKCVHATLPWKERKPRAGRRSCSLQQQLPLLEAELAPKDAELELSHRERAIAVEV